MQLEKLELELRPRPNMQALDLGFQLVRQHASDVYKGWLLLWGATVLLCALAATFLPPLFEFNVGFWLIVAWWLRPWLERSVLFILSREIFGEHVTWKEALRAWPKQLGGGWFRLFFLRPFMAHRGLYQAIWQLEGVRGRVASERIRVIGTHTTRSASIFGLALVHLEAIIQLGLFALAGVILSLDTINPFLLLTPEAQEKYALAYSLFTFFSYFVAVGIIGPIYTACTFTLYLNRRASLEAWDIELIIKQIKPPVFFQNNPETDKNTVPTIHQPSSRQSPSTLASFLIGCGISLAALLSNDSSYADHTKQDQKKEEVLENYKKCEPPFWMEHKKPPRSPIQNDKQKHIREEIDQIFLSPELIPYTCVQQVDLFGKKDKEKKDDFQFDRPRFGNGWWDPIALAAQYLAIAFLITAIIWLLLKYRGVYFDNLAIRKRNQVWEVGGLNIHPDSLPDHIAKEAWALWQQGKHREALALLYRASLSKLVEQNELILNQGATEQDCLRLSRQLLDTHLLSAERFTLFQNLSQYWVMIAYAHQDTQPDQDMQHFIEQWLEHFEHRKPTHANPTMKETPA